MFHTIKNVLHNLKGMTLVELLAVLSISSLIIIFSISILMSGVKNYEKTSIETILRDEADLIMLHLTKDIFTLKESAIDDVIDGSKIVLLPNDSGITEIGFFGSKIITREGEYKIQNKDIELLPDYSIQKKKQNPSTVKNGMNPCKAYEIKFTLKHTKKNIETTFVNEISTINDILID